MKKFPVLRKLWRKRHYFAYLQHTVVVANVGGHTNPTLVSYSNSLHLTHWLGTSISPIHLIQINNRSICTLAVFAKEFLVCFNIGHLTEKISANTRSLHRLNIVYWTWESQGCTKFKLQT